MKKIIEDLCGWAAPDAEHITSLNATVAKLEDDIMGLKDAHTKGQQSM